MATQVPEPNSLKGRKRLQNPSRYQLPHPAHVAMLILAMAIGLSYFGKDQGAVLKASPNTKVTERDQEFKVEVMLNGEEDTGAKAVLVQKESMKTLEALQRKLGSVLEHCEDGSCKIFTPLGQEITEPMQIQGPERLFILVPEGRLFMWPGFHIGYRTTVPSVPTISGLHIVVETISLSPRVFTIENLFTLEEADEVVASTLSLTDPYFKLQRSGTGNEKDAQVNNLRTSEAAFDHESRIAMELKRRCFEFLGIRPYEDSWADGLQVLRYNRTTAYIPHLDYFEPLVTPEYNFDSANGGANRFATILMYLNDVEEGGETVFVEASPDGKNLIPEYEALEVVRSKKLNKDFKRGSWEEGLIAQCHTRLKIKPKKGKAILFYNQLADGAVDEMSLHGACPVVKGIKWAANLWVWNEERRGYRSKETEETPPPEENIFLDVTFRSNVPNVSLYWYDEYWDPMGPGAKTSEVSTVAGHVWKVKSDATKETLRVWVINHEQKQEYVYP